MNTITPRPESGQSKTATSSSSPSQDPTKPLSPSPQVASPASNPGSPADFARNAGQLEILAAMHRYGSKDHSYSRHVAQEYSIPAALVLKYLAFRIKNSRTILEGCQWHPQSISSIQKQYPYLSASTIHSAIQSLPDTVLLRRRIPNTRIRDKTQWYALAGPGVAKAVNSDLLYFSPAHAAEYGIHEAVLLHKLLRWIVIKGLKKGLRPFHPVPPANLASKLMISRASIARALKHLVGAKVLVKNPNPAGRTPEYGFVLPSPLLEKPLPVSSP